MSKYVNMNLYAEYLLICLCMVSTSDIRCLICYINTLIIFWPILGQIKTIFVVFLWKMRTNSVVFLPILFLMALHRPLEIILAKKTTEHILLFHKNITKLVFLWTNMSQKCIKLLSRSIHLISPGLVNTIVGQVLIYK